MSDGAAMLVAGMALGFASSAPVGVINLWVVDATLARSRRAIAAFVVGVILVDMMFAGAAAWGYAAFIEGSGAARWLEIGGGAMLIGLGIAGLRRRGAAPAESAGTEAAAGAGTVARARAREFALGALMCGANPAFVMFWVFAMQMLQGELGLDPDSVGLAAFVAGVGIGDLAWFATISTIADRSRSAVQPQMLQRVRVGFAVAFVVAGGIAVASGVRAGGQGDEPAERQPGRDSKVVPSAQADERRAFLSV